MTATKGRACDGKNPYPSHKAATAQMWYLIRRKGAARDQLNVYQCDFCGQYHVGHKPVTRQGKRRSQ
jgi:hypothetical protein